MSQLEPLDETLLTLARLGEWAHVTWLEMCGDSTTEACPSAPEGAEEQGIIIIPDTPEEAEDAIEEGGNVRVSFVSVAGLGSGDEDNTVSDAEADEFEDVDTAQMIPVLDGSGQCRLEGCTFPVFNSQTEGAFEFCCRSHGRRYAAKQRGERVGATNSVCLLPGCVNLVHVDLDGTAFPYCSRYHGRVMEGEETGPESQLEAGGGGLLMRDLYPARGEGDEACARSESEEVSPEFTSTSRIVCVRPACGQLVIGPRQGQTTRPPVQSWAKRYNFCSTDCYEHVQTGAGQSNSRVRGSIGSIPFSTTMPLAKAWYRAMVEKAQSACEGGAPGSEESQAGSQTDSQEVMEPVRQLSDFSAAAIASVMRCRALMTRLMASRSSPYKAQYSGGKSKCALCQESFSRGQMMVKCYVDPAPDTSWVHVVCAQTIITAKGGPLLHPSLGGM